MVENWRFNCFWRENDQKMGERLEETNEENRNEDSGKHEDFQILGAIMTLVSDNDLGNW